MILDLLENSQAYERLSGRLAAGFRFLRETDLDGAAVGRVEVADGVFALIQDYDTKPVDRGFFESHRKHIDIQYVVSGAERVGWAPIGRLRVSEGFDEAKDLIKYAMPAGSDMEWVVLRAGMFAVFYPGDGHMPSIDAEGTAAVRKVVVKVAV